MSRKSRCIRKDQYTTTSNYTTKISNDFLTRETPFNTLLPGPTYMSVQFEKLTLKYGPFSGKKWYVSSWWRFTWFSIHRIQHTFDVKLTFLLLTPAESVSLCVVCSLQVAWLPSICKSVRTENQPVTCFLNLFALHVGVCQRVWCRVLWNGQNLLSQDGVLRMLGTRI